jgi:hypothetical protein
MVNNEWGKEFYGKKGFRVKILREKKVGVGGNEMMNEKKVGMDFGEWGKKWEKNILYFFYLSETKKKSLKNKILQTKNIASDGPTLPMIKFILSAKLTHSVRWADANIFSKNEQK